MRTALALFLLLTFTLATISGRTRLPRSFWSDEDIPRLPHHSKNRIQPPQIRCRRCGIPCHAQPRRRRGQRMVGTFWHVDQSQMVALNLQTRSKAQILQLLRGRCRPRRQLRQQAVSAHQTTRQRQNQEHQTHAIHQLRMVLRTQSQPR